MARRKNRVLILGNGPQINDIDFSSLDSDVITIGVNRIWLKHYPDFFFFHDYAILHELNQDENRISKIKLTQSSHCYSSEWIKKTVRGPIPSWLRVYPMPFRSSFPDSVTNAVNIYRNVHLKQFPISDYTFYFAGVSLNWTDPSHFWKIGNSSKKFNNNHSKKWYDARFSHIYENFIKMKSLGYKMISVTPGSRLNKLMRYESIGNLYSN